jgi:hypothetical protein
MSDIYIDVHGLSHHFSGAEYQQANAGAGIRFENQSDGKRVMMAVGAYLNSLGRTTAYAATGVSWKIMPYFDVGLVCGVSTGYNVAILPSVFPAVSFGGNAYRLNIAVMPEIENVTPAVVALSIQVKIR